MCLGGSCASTAYAAGTELEFYAGFVKCITNLLIKVPALIGAFYFFNSPTNPTNPLSMPDTIVTAKYHKRLN